MIQTLENFLRPYVERNPTGWSQQLALVEFAINNAIHVATGHSAFFLNSGDYSKLPIDTSVLLPSRVIVSLRSTLRVTFLEQRFIVRSEYSGYH